MRTQLFAADAVARFLSDVLEAEGIPCSDARVVGDLMVEADLLGGDGHGLFRLPRYVSRLKAGGFNKNPSIRVERRDGAMALVDGDNAMGHLVMKHCAKLATEIAREQGVAWVGAHHSNHAGAAGVYAMMPLTEDMIGLYVAVGNANHMAPWGGTKLLLSTNPIAVAIPGESGAILLDMATTNVAYGKVKLAAQRGEQMPEGWMIDGEGRPLTDPHQAASGSLLPIGGAKGYGLSLIFGLLAGTLNGAAFGSSVIDFNADDKSVTNTGQFIVAINIRHFCDPIWFKKSVEAVRAEMKASPTRPGFDEIRLPGERALATRERRLQEGVPVTPAMLAELDRIARDAGVAPMSERVTSA
ncbi:LDH2 family malate/lactate/ureidoglycolate dehydrogenase [Pseudorhizobium tarimense]|uniref:LDH2 family malate/lactate/ureidoglycolate dehydrogenase n=1 Tax=Pseudorhizobium tarimense TaxID=1079109 RepID=A0ABV2HD58_9HYPH|nr:Ldh family oxidoreductase [Pseudorhizobium tarimense]MCJ8521432.1 Ldh family oxidoreductase [Pseudorhizobium tarimense]